MKGETFWIASDAALAKPAVTEAMGELVARYAKAQEWASVHRAQWAATFAHITGLPASVALLYVNRSPYLTVPITSQNIIKPLQEEADFFHQQHVLSSPLNVKGLFYTKFNKRV